MAKLFQCFEKVEYISLRLIPLKILLKVESDQRLKWWECLKEGATFTLKENCAANIKEAVRAVDIGPASGVWQIQADITGMLD